MKIVSWTLTNNRRETLPRALKSVLPLVDKCIVIDTGVTDDTLALAFEVAGEKLVIAPHTWVDFSDARNFALEVAAQYGSWGLMLDSDEWVTGELPPTALLLADVYLVPHSSNTYTRERLYRLPATGKFQGPTHEAYISPTPLKVLQSSLRFHDEEKSEIDNRLKRERDIKLLEPHTRNHPGDPRWWFYLGDAYDALGRTGEAILAFRKCAALLGWDEQSAWACYREAICHHQKKDYVEAELAAARGLTHRADFPELAWYAGVVCENGGDPVQAIRWAKLALTMPKLDPGRIGFKHLPAHYEGPYDVLHHAYKALGMVEDAKLALTNYETSLKERLSVG